MLALRGHARSQQAERRPSLLRLAETGWAEWEGGWMGGMNFEEAAGW